MPEKKRRVLIAEDEALIAMTLEDVLTAAGYEVTVAYDGAQAFVAASEREFDLLLTDLNMPGLSGEQLIARLRARRPNLPVVVLTGSPPSGGAPALQRPGEAPVALLVKPLHDDDLVLAVAHAL